MKKSKQPKTLAEKMYNSLLEQEALLSQIRCSLREQNMILRISSKATLDALQVISKNFSELNPKWVEAKQREIDLARD